MCVSRGWGLARCLWWLLMMWVSWLCRWSRWWCVRCRLSSWLGLGVERVGIVVVCGLGWGCVG